MGIKEKKNKMCFNDLIILSFNIRSFNNTKKEWLEEKIKKYKAEVICIQEGGYNYKNEWIKYESIPDIKGFDKYGDILARTVIYVRQNINHTNIKKQITFKENMHKKNNNFLYMAINKRKKK